MATFNQKVAKTSEDLWTQALRRVYQETLRESGHSLTLIFKESTCYSGVSRDSRVRMTERGQSYDGTICDDRTWKRYRKLFGLKAFQ